MPHDTALIDSQCANLLRRRLEAVAAVAGDITITVAKLDRVNRGAGLPEDLGWWREVEADPRRPATNLAIRAQTDRSALPPMSTPASLGAAARHDAAVGELTTWARHIGEERGHYLLGGVARHPLAGIALYLIENLEWLRHRPEADEAFLTLLAACSELVSVVDTRIPGELIGMCSCGTARYGNDHACRRCGAEDLTYTRADLDRGRDDLAVTASEAARYVADTGLILGTKGSTDRLRKLIWAWADRGHISPVDDVPRYRLGDVLERVLASPALLRAA